MVIKKASGRVPGRASGSSRSRVDDDGGSRCVSRKLIQCLGFSHRGEYIGGRAASGDGPAGLAPWWRCQGLGRATLGCGQALAPLRLIFRLHDASGKIEGSAFDSSNSENISCVAFLEHKNSRKQGTGTVASR
jgi:hypothetical protein